MDQSPSNAGQQVIHRSFMLAAETKELCRPIHILAALAELEGPISHALLPLRGRLLLPRRVDPPQVTGGAVSYTAMQTQHAASTFAYERGEPMKPEHLLLAVIDQRDPEVVEVLDHSGLDLVTVRRMALRMLEAPENLPAIAIPPLVPAGTMDRPPLPVSDLDPRAWSALCWRREHLPLRRVRRLSHYAALRHLESRGALQVASKLALDDDQRYSLLRHHLDRVEQLVAHERPELVELRPADSEVRGSAAISTTRPRRRRRPGWMSFTIGWGTWFANRQVSLRNRWFKFRTIRHFRHAPQL